MGESRIETIEALLRHLADEFRALKTELTGPPGKAPSPGDASSVGQQLAAYLGLDPFAGGNNILTLILRCAMHTVAAGGAGLTIYDHQKNKLVFRAAVGDGSQGIIGYEIPLEGSQHGLAFATGEIQASAPLHKEIEAQARAQFASVLVAPLFVGEEGVGTISAVNKQMGGHFNPTDMASFKHFADLAAVVVRQHLREEMLLSAIDGKIRPDALPLNLYFSPEDTAVFTISRNLMAIARNAPHLLPVVQQLSDMLRALAEGKR